MCFSGMDYVRVYLSPDETCTCVGDDVRMELQTGMVVELAQWHHLAAALQCAISWQA